MKTGNVPKVSIEEMRQLAAKYQAQADKYYNESIVAKAQIYDLKNIKRNKRSNDYLKVVIYDLEKEVVRLKNDLAKTEKKIDSLIKRGYEDDKQT